MRILPGLWVAGFLIGVSLPSAGAKTPAPRAIGKAVLEIAPLPVVLSDPREVRRVLVSMKQPDGGMVDVTPVAKLKTTSDVVSIDDAGMIHPLKDGHATVEVQAEGLTAQFDITVQGAGRERPIGFVKDVMPILGKAGCNSGPCHGGAKGKNGFKLSLRGYDPNFDYEALIQDLSGRRFNRAVPEDSLILLKPTMGVAHGGGLRFAPGSRYYKTLLEWIRQGVSFSDQKEGMVVKLRVVPPEIFMNKPGLSQQVLAVAEYPDGSQRDVTAESIYISSLPSVAEISDTGRVKSLRKGETAIQVRYQGQSVTVPLTAVTEKPGFKWTQLPQHNFIDRLVDEKLKRLKVLSSDICTDAEFIRRVSLDLTGLLPGPEDVRAFLDDPAESQIKRTRLIDKLLASPEYVDHWSLKWGDLLLSNRRFLGEKGVWSYRNWIRQSIAENKPYDQFVRDIVVASGSTYENPPSNFFRATREPKVMMESASQLFLGVRMMCANCHDHPFEPWTQRNYYEMTAFFGGVTLKDGAQSDEEIVYEKRNAYEIRHPKYGYVVPARFPFAAPDHVDSDKNRREQFADWLTSQDNPYFAVSISNRIWSYFFARGIINPVDDLRPSNPSTNPALLAALAADLKRNRMDLKQLMRRITTSRIYQTSYRSNEWNEEDEQNFSHQRPRRLSAEELLDALSLATGSNTDFEGVPKGYRAQQLPDSRVGVGGFLDLFGRPPRESSCECERRGDISLAQALNLVNGGVVADAIADPDGRVARLILSGATDQKIVDSLYLATLSRPPDEKELASSIKYLKDGSNRTERAQDLLWALLNSHSFLFNR